MSAGILILLSGVVDSSEAPKSMLEMREMPTSERSTDNSFAQEKRSILSRILRIKVKMPIWGFRSCLYLVNLLSLYFRGKGNSTAGTAKNSRTSNGRPLQTVA